MYYDILMRLYQETRDNKIACDNGDSEAAAVTNAKVGAFLEVLQMMGHKVRRYAWDNGYHKIIYLSLDGVLLFDGDNWQEEFGKLCRKEF